MDGVGSLFGAIPDGKIPKDVFHFVICKSLMLFYKFINTQTLTLNLQNITKKRSLNK